MAKVRKELSPEFTKWIDDLNLPDEQKALIRENYVKTAGEQILELQNQKDNVHAGMTQAQQRAAAWDKFAEENRDIFQHWQDLAPHLKKLSPQALIERLREETPRQQPQQVLHQRDEAYEAIRTKLDSGEIEWDDAKAAIRAIDRRLEQLYGSTEQIGAIQNEWAKFKEQEVPTFIGGFQKTLEDVKEQQRNVVRAIASYVNDALEYKSQHPKRDIRKIYDAYANGKHESYEDAAREVYGEEDLDSVIQDRAERKFQDFLKARPKTQDPAEGSMASGSMAVFQRPHRRMPPEQQQQTPAAPAFPKSEAAARNMIFDLLNEPPAQQVTR